MARHGINYKYRHNGRPPRQDNKTYYTNRRARYSRNENNAYTTIIGATCFTIRVPSLKRGRSTWKRFYRLFPGLKWVDSLDGHKLKKI